MAAVDEVVYVEIVINVYFVFQAEDGIRDVAVTGVQTCALPIYSRAGPSRRRLWPRPRICPDDAERAEGPVDRRDVCPGPDPHLLQSGGVLVRLWDGFDVVDVNPEFGSGVSRHACPPGLQWVSGRVALSERSQRRRVICEASPSGHATERTTSPPPARSRAGDGDAVNTDSQDAVGRAWSSDRSSVAVGNCGAS